MNKKSQQPQTVASCTSANKARKASTVHTPPVSRQYSNFIVCAHSLSGLKKLICYQIEFVSWKPLPPGSNLPMSPCSAAGPWSVQHFKPRQVGGSPEGANNPFACESRTSCAPTKHLTCSDMRYGNRDGPFIWQHPPADKHRQVVRCTGWMLHLLLFSSSPSVPSCTIC